MSTILYIKASPRTGRSYSIAVADAFLDSYHQLHPTDRIKIVDIFAYDLPPFDLNAVNVKYKIMHGVERSPQDRNVWNNIVAVIEEFKSADKYVMAVPMWNFSIPYRLKQYLDIIVQPTYIFAVDEKGNYHGLIRNKPIFIAYARGGEYSPGTDAEPFDLQKKYLDLILGFIGFTDIRSIVIDLTLAVGPDIAKQKRIQAVEKAKQIAVDF